MRLGSATGAYDLMERHPELSPDITGDGPGIENLDKMERTLRK